MQIYHSGKNKRFILYECKVIFRELKPRFEPVFAYSGGILKRKIMPKIIQNLVFLMEPETKAYQISSTGATMCLNRFCIDENAAFELSGVRYLKESDIDPDKGHQNIYERKTKAKGY